jgi:phage shock protein PspC (stress-responsive transcriptional regulator)
MKHKKLHRDVANKWIFGVCSGLGKYLNADPLLIRIAFILLLFASAPAAILIYLVFAAVMPAEDVLTDYRDESGNIENVNTDGIIEKSSEKNDIFLGLLLITLGVIFLLDDFFPWISLKKLWPVILIFLGIYFVVQSFGNNDDDVIIYENISEDNKEPENSNGTTEPNETYE